MAKNTVPRGEASVIRHVFIQDSASTTGGGKTGLAYNTASLTGYYIYPGGVKTALTLEDIATLGTYAAPTSNAYLRFKELDAVNMPGWYELQFHNDWFSVANARRTACVQLKGAAGMAPLNLEIDCIGMEIQDADPSVDATKVGGSAQTGGDLAALINTLTSYIPALAVTSGAVATDAGNSSSSFKTNLSSAVNDFWKDTLLLITSGALAGQVKKVTGYTGATKIIATGAFTDTPADGVTFVLINK